MRKFNLDKALEAMLAVVMIIALIVLAFLLVLLTWQLMGVYSIPANIMGAFALFMVARYVYEHE